MKQSCLGSGSLVAADFSVTGRTRRMNAMNVQLALCLATAVFVLLLNISPNLWICCTRLVFQNFFLQMSSFDDGIPLLGTNIPVFFSASNVEVEKSPQKQGLWQKRRRKGFVSAFYPH